VSTAAQQAVAQTVSAPASAPAAKRAPSLLNLLGPYRGWVALLVVFTVLANGLSLTLPLLIARGIDAYGTDTLALGRLALEFLAAAAAIFVFTYVQNIVQAYAAEKVARDLREKIADKISRQSIAFVQEITPSKLLTNLTSDVDGVKQFVSMAIAAIISSLFLIFGSAILLLITNWRLALAVLAIIPIIGGTFFLVLRKVRVLFKKGQEVIDWLNKVINESIIGAALIRVMNATQQEYDKFLAANTGAKDTGMRILKLFAAMIPVVTFVSNMATLVILLLGGRFVIQGSMTLGDFAAFNSYVAIFIFPIFILGFMSNIIARASASYKRIGEVLASEERPDTGTIEDGLRGEIEFQSVTVAYGEKTALKDVSFRVAAGSRTAIIGPTAAGKSVLMSLLTGLRRPTEGLVLIDGKPIDDYAKAKFHAQVGFVFQDSAMFNLTMRENIAFSRSVSDGDLKKALETAELTDFVAGLPAGLDTVVTERGSNLSGGQKQRIMLARALALNPRILLLDDFTARVDTLTEQKILVNVAKNYPGITLVSVTQKIAPIEDFEQVILLMEGELLAAGTHAQLMETSPEYIQIAQSQRSTNVYELQPE
jgi:ATP-binding cassette, subfamily B, bacterial